MFTVGGSYARLSRVPIGSDHKMEFLRSEPVCMPISMTAGPCSQHIASNVYTMCINALQMLHIHGMIIMVKEDTI